MLPWRRVRGELNKVCCEGIWKQHRSPTNNCSSMAKIAASLQSNIQPRRPLRQTDTIIV